MQKAGALLSRRPYSKGELRDKIRKLADGEQVEATLDRLEAVGLLNDAEYAYNFAFRRIMEMAWGPARVRSSLIRRQVPPQVAEAAIDRVQQGVSEELLLSRYVDRFDQKRGLPTNRRAIQKLISHLRSRGFNEDLIWDTRRRKIPVAAWRKYDTGE